MCEYCKDEKPDAPSPQPDTPTSKPRQPATEPGKVKPASDDKDKPCPSFGAGDQEPDGEEKDNHGRDRLKKLVQVESLIL